jgi:hypothetical protein
VQNWTTCERNPVALDIPARVIRSFRGGAVLWSLGRGNLEVATGRADATVYTNGERRAHRAARGLRRMSQSAPGPLPPPAFPRAVMAELKRVVVARRRHAGAQAIGEALGLEPGHVRVRLRLARLLPPAALAGVDAPRRSWSEVEQDRQISFWVSDFGVRKTMERFDLSALEVRRAARRARGLTGSC